MGKAKSSLIVGWRLVGKHVAVVGGDLEAQRRVETAISAGACVTVFATEITPAIEIQVKENQIGYYNQISPDDLSGIDMVLATIGDCEASRELASQCRSKGIPVHVADVRALCDFWFPSVYQDGPLQIAVSTNGYGPALGGRLRDYLGARVPANFRSALMAFNDLRGELRKVDGSGDRTRRMKWMTNFARSTSLSSIAGLDEEKKSELIASYVAGEGNLLSGVDERVDHGLASLILVGAGPGDPKLLTVAAVEALHHADLVVADRLVPAQILQLVECELRIAPKFPGKAELAQSKIYEWTETALAEGKSVVRLKVGDPFVFGRGGEEMEHFSRLGYSPSVIPGVSSALAAPALSGISLTQRGVADQVVICTGVGKGGSKASLPDYRAESTLVLLMAVKSLSSICSRLMEEHGYPAGTPVSVVESASRLGQREVSGSVGLFSKNENCQDLVAPAVVVIGSCAATSSAKFANELLQDVATG